LATLDELMVDVTVVLGRNRMPITPCCAWAEAP
jgi:flagellar motor switch/type III secretory pathway protein FliN